MCSTVGGQTHSEMLDCGSGPDAGSSRLGDGWRLQHQLHVVCKQSGNNQVFSQVWLKLLKSAAEGGSSSHTVLSDGSSWLSSSFGPDPLCDNMLWSRWCVLKVNGEIIKICSDTASAGCGRLEDRTAALMHSSATHSFLCLCLCNKSPLTGRCQWETFRLSALTLILTKATERSVKRTKGPTEPMRRAGEERKVSCC